MIKILLTILLLVSPHIGWGDEMICPLDGKPIKAKGVKSLEIFKRIPILDNGRVKPIDSYARHILLQFSGKDTFNRHPAINWLTALIFAPDSTKDDKIFLINNPDIPSALNIESDTHRRYSFSQLQKNYSKLVELAEAAKEIAQKERSIVENEIIRVYENVHLYAKLSHQFMFVFPHEDFNNQSFFDTVFKADELQDKLSQKDPEAVQLVSNLYQWSQTYKGLPFYVLPKSNEPDIWLSPWDAIAMDFKNDKTRHLIALWRNMVVSYWNGESLQFNIAARAYLDIMHTKQMNTFGIELTYNKLTPFLWAKIFYMLALIFFVASFMSRKRWWYNLSWAAILAGIIPHIWAIASRCIIMGRPPVSNLYETFIFVSAVTVLLGIAIEKVNKQWLGLVVAGISGTALLFIASKYSAEGDTLQVLIAVLNSNFWLATHVTTITMGYGATCVAGILGHIWLVQAASKKSQDVLNNTYTVMMGLLGLSLVLTFLGTNLGGIWADQSWGRFWGWDPKENGALMIVIWSAMLFHVRIAKLAGQRGMAVGTVLGMIVVMWAWFGVNLLSIGLHSYGFTSGIANALLIYLLCEIIFLVVTTYLTKRR
jgi:ABC-type transport system involved in cytochrome c biogenesis permease subunit